MTPTSSKTSYMLSVKKVIISKDGAGGWRRRKQIKKVAKEDPGDRINENKEKTEDERGCR
jgi:hypothetical protein